GVDCATYSVRFSDIPADGSFSPPEAGDDEATDSDAVPSEDDPSVGVTPPVELTPEDPDSPNVNAGITPPGECTVGDYVWSDEDADGVQDDGEPGVPGVTVELLDADGTVVGTAAIDRAARKAIEEVESGEHEVGINAAEHC